MTRSSRYIPPEIRRSRGGRTIQEAAELTGLSRQTISRWTGESRDTWLNRAAQRRERIRELREQGLSMRAIAAEVGCGVGTVHRAIHAN